MRHLLLAALGALAVAGVASAQQPQSPYYSPAQKSVYPTSAATPTTGVYPASGTSYVRGSGCTNCGVPAVSKFSVACGPGCQLGAPCANGCGSVKSDFAFHFGSCKGFFSPCGPTLGYGHSKCPVLPLAAPYGEGWHCPRQYDSYANH